MWGLIDPDMFVSVADTLEDVMQASVPGVIENVRVAEINQGDNPFRILSLRSLPDGHVKGMKDEIHRQNEKNKDPQALAADEEGGDYYNMECSFAYHAKPANGTSQKAKNMHMQLVFYLGMKGLFGVYVPINCIEWNEANFDTVPSQFLSSSKVWLERSDCVSRCHLSLHS
jgi:Ca2+-dependent lipid-binding protein